MENQIKSLRLEKFLFGFIRIFTIGGALIGVIALILVIFNLLSSGENVYVSLDDINTESITKNNSVTEASAKPKESINIPENVKKYLSGDNEKILQGWLGGIFKQKQKQEFVDNLSDVIVSAEEKKVKVVNVINNYKTIKLSKLSKSEIEQYKEIGQRVAIYMVIFGLVIFIVLMSLILVMLGIERNTRCS